MSVFASQSTIRSTVSRVMISLRFGPAFTWQCTQVRLQSLPTLTCKNFGAPAAERERTFGKRLGESIHYKSAATAAVATAEKFISFCRCCVESKKIHERESVDSFL